VFFLTEIEQVVPYLVLLKPFSYFVAMDKVFAAQFHSSFALDSRDNILNITRELLILIHDMFRDQWRL
jgi:hypothetical protein